jgi:hypothetical protein
MMNIQFQRIVYLSCNNNRFEIDMLLKEENLEEKIHILNGSIKRRMETFLLREEILAHFLVFCEGKNWKRRNDGKSNGKYA